MMPARRLAPLCASLCFAAACASVHSGNLATPADGATAAGDPHRTRLGLVVSGKELDELGSAYFGVVDFVFENRTEGWIRIKTVTLDLGSEARNREVFLPWGTDLVRWYEAATQKLAIAGHNRQLFLSTLALAGAVAGGVSGSNTGVLAGTTVALGATTVMAVDDIGATKRAAENAPIYPESHLLAGGFAIPPGLFTRRWVLLNTKDHARLGYLSALVVRYETEAGVSERVRLVFRNGVCGSPWQREVCAKTMGGAGRRTSW
jgi:hypothetical protein